jgi:hypothetical protein
MRPHFDFARVLVALALAAPLHLACAAVPLAPWLPLREVGDILVMSDKQLRLSALGLPEQISVAGSPLLAQGVGLSVDGVPATAISSGAWQLAETADHAEYAARIRGGAGQHELEISIKTEVWFDGLVTIDLSTPHWPDELRAKPLRYRIALGPNLARFMHRYGPVGARNFDLTSSGTPLEFAYTPFVWLGDDARGLFWFSETTDGWRNAGSTGALSLVRDQERVALEVTIIPQRSRSGSWHHRFGLLPTPTKPLPHHWRALRMLPAPAASMYVMWPNDKEIGAPYFGYPESLQPEKFARDVAAYRRGGVTALPYACPTWIATTSPEWREHSAEWDDGVADVGFGDGPRGRFVNICPARSSWKAWVRERFPPFIERYQLSGLYMDNAQVYATQHCLTSGDDGDVAEFPMLDQRSGYRDIMTALRKNARETKAVAHSSGGMNLPTLSFVDAWVDGEQYRDVVKNDYLDVASLTDFRVELNSSHWGLAAIFLPEFTEENARAVAPTRKLMSILMLHDAVPWPQFANVEEIQRDVALLDAFDVGDAEFVPYYAARPLGRTPAAGVFISGYRKGERSLMIVANLAKEATATEICPDVGTVGVAKALYSWPEKKIQPLVGGCLPVSLDAGSFRMLLAIHEDQRSP